VASYNDSKLTELLPVAKLVRFLRLEPPDEPLSTEGASLRTTRTLPHGSLHVTIRNLVHTSTSTEDADGEADATEESALDALEDAMAMLDDFHRAVSQVVQTRDRMACEKAIKAQEAEALREEVTASPSARCMSGSAAGTRTCLDCAQVSDGCGVGATQAEKLTPLLTQHVLHVGLDKGELLVTAAEDGARRVLERRQGK
jgi:hypothetical protein